MTHELPKLRYADNALEPAISAKTIEFHHGKHHQAYVNNLNNLIKTTKFESFSLEQIICEAEGAIFNNAAQIWNHTFYFNSFAAKPQGEPSGELLKLIEAKFESFNGFKEQFTKAATTLFGSGWAWLVLNKNGELEILQTSNAGNPLRDGFKPLLTCDVWEHAYYIDYQNRRPDYIAQFWNIVDWKIIEERL